VPASVAQPPNIVTLATPRSTHKNQSPKTSAPVDPLVIFREPAMAAKPIVSRIRYQIVKMSREDAMALMGAETSEGRKAPTLVAVRFPGSIGLI
jgi:hypothetical protein